MGLKKTWNVASVMQQQYKETNKQQQKIKIK